MNPLFTRTDRTIWGRWWWTIDRQMLAALIVLMIIGVFLVAAASPPVAMRIGLNQYYFIVHHIIVLIPSFLIMIGLSLCDPRTVWRIASIMLLGCLMLMVVVLFTGMEIKGAQRWIQLPGFSLQPSEFAKPSFAVVAAWLISRQKERADFPGYAITAGIFIVLVTLLMLQPDFGMTFVTVCILGVQIFLAGMPLLLVGGALLALGGGVLMAYAFIPHVHVRIERFLDPAHNDTYQIDKALEAIRHGGLFGTGPGQGTVKLLIPDAHADFIYAVAGEELGFVFLAALLLLFAYIILRGLNRVMDSDNMFLILSTGGLLTQFGIQALIHIASNLHLAPTKGMTLPFISYGGSSLLAISVTMGMALALTRRQPKTSIALNVSGAPRAALAEQK